MRTIKKFPKLPIRPAGRFLTVVKHQICSPRRRSRLYEHLSFNMIENLLCLGFISLYLWFCYVIFTRSILSTPACDVLLYVRLKTTCAAIKLRKRLLTISKINITRWNMYRDNNFHSRRYVLRVSVSENQGHKLINFKNLADLSRLPGVCFTSNWTARQEYRSEFSFYTGENHDYIVLFGTLFFAFVVRRC